MLLVKVQQVHFGNERSVQLTRFGSESELSKFLVFVLILITTWVEDIFSGFGKCRVIFSFHFIKAADVTAFYHMFFWLHGRGESFLGQSYGILYFKEKKG